MPAPATTKIGCHEAAGLPLPQARIQAITCDQFGVCAAFHDRAALHHHQPIHACDGGQAMGDGDDRLALHQRIQAVLDGRFHFRIQGRGGFIQHQDRRVFQQHACNGDALALAA